MSQKKRSCLLESLRTSLSKTISGLAHLRGVVERGGNFGSSCFEPRCLALSASPASSCCAKGSSSPSSVPPALGACVVLSQAPFMRQLTITVEKPSVVAGTPSAPHRPSSFSNSYRCHHRRCCRCCCCSPMFWIFLAGCFGFFRRHAGVSCPKRGVSRTGRRPGQAGWVHTSLRAYRKDVLGPATCFLGEPVTASFGCCCLFGSLYQGNMDDQQFDRVHELFS